MYRYIFIFYILFSGCSGIKFFIQQKSPAIRNELEILNFLSENSYLDRETISKWCDLKDLQILVETEFNSLVSVNSEINKSIRKFQKSLGLEETGIFGEEMNVTRRVKRTVEKEVLRRDNEMESFTSIDGLLPHISNLTWIYINHTNSFPERDMVRRAIHQSLTEWKRAFGRTLGTIEMYFTEIISPDADIKISFHSGDHFDGYAFDGRGRVLAHAFYPITSRRGQVHLDLDEDWDADLLYDVLLHELGHTFGLGHSSVNTSVMFAWYSKKGSLDQDDKNGIFSKYQDKSIKVFGPITPYSTTLRPSTLRPSTLRPIPFIPSIPKRKIVNRPVIINRNGKAGGSQNTLYIYNSTVYIQ